jgi:integrase
MAKRNGLPANVSEFQDRHGKWRLRYRAKGQPTYYFKGMPGSELFREELEACRAAKIAPASATRRSPPGSISALIALYYGTPAYTGLAASSQKTYRSVLERFRNEHGLKSVATLERRHIKTILGGMSATPAAANKLLDKLKILMALAMDEGWRKDDPTQGVKGFKIRSDGFHTWTEDEIETYCAVHGLGTKARLALDLMLYTGQRRSDAVLMGKQHFDAGRVRVRQLKTGAVVSDYGLPFSSNGFGNKMRDWCDAANLSHCASHGLRKAAARRLAEAGCTHEQIKAITGHTTDAEVSRYVAAANQLKLADQAIDAIDPTSRTG